MYQDFIGSGLKTISGKQLEIISPGKWNHEGGPGFQQACLRIDGGLQNGDVEIHFDASDWELHGHDRNGAFQKVILHVVLFEPKPLTEGSLKRDSNLLETLYLLPNLETDLESYVGWTALREIEAVDPLEWVNAFMGLGAARQLGLLERAGRRRWKQKVSFGKIRLQSLGWNAACHQYFLEV
ncbi:MAG: Uncharacterised protein [Opitutia bacterium UBA7350]|nr:MAG: Uncharacterised protein [Opitutae bacterium UBA7350]